MSVAEKIETPKERISEEAAKALEESGGDLHRAVALFEGRVRARRELRDALMEPLIRSACYNAIRWVIRTQRAVIWRSSQPSSSEAKGKVITLARATREALMDFVLPGGRTLREARGQEVSQAAEFYRLQATNMGHKARWLHLIAESVPPDEKVVTVLSEDRLRELKAEASHG